MRFAHPPSLWLGPCGSISGATWSAPGATWARHDTVRGDDPPGPPALPLRPSPQYRPLAGPDGPGSLSRSGRLAVTLRGSLLDTIYQAYFGDAADVFDPAVLATIAATAGLDPEDVKQVLGGDDYADEVRADEQQAQQIGIRGVPFYVLDGRLGMSGAQSTETFAEALRQAAG